MDLKVQKLKEVHAIIMALRATSGTNSKRDLLKMNEANATLKLFLYHVYEPSISYYQTKIAVVPKSMGFDEVPVDLTYDIIDDLIEKLSERQITGHEASYFLGNLYNNLSENWMRDLITILIERDIKAGIKYKNINKVWPGLITHVPYMRCSLPKKVKLENWPWAQGIESEIKYDGMYADVLINIHDANKDRVRSRAGSLMPNAPFAGILYELHRVVERLVSDNQKLFAGEEYVVFNGEFEMLDSSGALMPRALGNGKFNSLLQTGEVPSGLKPQYKVWDFVPGTKYEAGAFAMPRRERKAALALSFVGISGQAELGKSVKCYSWADAVKDFKAKRALGLEGTIVKHPEGPWEDGTSKYQVKVKAEVEIDLELVSFNAGSGRNEDTFGSIQFKSSCGKLVVDVNGRTDEMREFFHANRESLPGSIHTVLSNELMKPSKPGGLYSLFLPRYQIARPDKTVADSLSRIIDIFASVMKDEEEDE